MEYIFSPILLFFCISYAIYYNKQSKPVQLYLNPVLARSSMLERYLEIENMPTGSNKLQAYKHWQRDCQTLRKQLSKQNKKLTVVSRKA